MNIIISQQLIFFLKSILLGAFLGLFFDVFKILRLLIKHHNIFIFIEDILFFLISAIFSYNFMMNISYGQIRLFILTGELIGFILYKLSISNLIVKAILFVISKLINLLKILFKNIIRFFIKPFYKSILYIFKIIFCPLTKIFGENVKFIKKLLKKTVMIMYNLVKSSFIRKKIID